MKLLCVYCKKEITGCCYPAYDGVKKIGYRHVSCYPETQHSHSKVIVEDYNYDYDDVRAGEDET